MTLVAQEMDDEYLESLPEGVRKDVLDKMEAENDMKKPVYLGRHSSRARADQYFRGGGILCATWKARYCDRGGYA